MATREQRTGPRGGKTTVSKRGLIRKTFWIHEGENEALRRAAFEERKTETEISEAIQASCIALADTRSAGLLISSLVGQQGATPGKSENDDEAWAL